MKSLTPKEAEFKAGVRQHLSLLTPRLTDVLRQMVLYPFVKEVHALDFEVFSDQFTSGFPVRAFFMDEDNCEYFLYENHKAQYPCEVDPELLEIPHVYSEEFEESFDDLDAIFELAAHELILWFAECWRAAGGLEFSRQAYISEHDGGRRFDLVNQQWDA